MKKLIANLYEFFVELHRRNPLLFNVSLAHVAALVVFLVIAPFDNRLVTGVNPWIKPMKFAISTAIYMPTIGWILADLPIGLNAKYRASLYTAVLMVVEVALITLQAARGVQSHFNQTSPLNGAIFGVMGLGITLSTVIVGYITYQYWRTSPPLPAAYLWGVRLGLALFMLASFEGFVMVAHMAHTIGAADGGQGLPLVNWSTRAGDLRIAHFLGMHALQVLPFLGYFISSRTPESDNRRSVLWVWLAGVAYTVVAIVLFVQALCGYPLLSI